MKEPYCSNTEVHFCMNTQQGLELQQYGSSLGDISSRQCWEEGFDSAAEDLHWLWGECVNIVTKPYIYRHFHAEV